MAHAFRLADAFGAEVVFVGTRPDDVDSQLSEFFPHWHEVRRKSFESFDSAARYLTARGIVSIAVEVTARSRPYYGLEYPSDVPLALAVGSEGAGIPEDVLSEIERHVHIPMKGRRSALNVGMSLAIVASHLTFQDGIRRAHQARDGFGRAA